MFCEFSCAGNFDVRKDRRYDNRRHWHSRGRGRGRGRGESFNISQVLCFVFVVVIVDDNDDLSTSWCDQPSDSQPFMFRQLKAEAGTTTTVATVAAAVTLCKTLDACRSDGSKEPEPKDRESDRDRERQPSYHHHHHHQAHTKGISSEELAVVVVVWGLASFKLALVI